MVVVWIYSVMVDVGTPGKTVDGFGKVTKVGTVSRVTVGNQVGIGVVHELAGTETKLVLGTAMVATKVGTSVAVATITKVEKDEMVAMLESGRLLIAHSAETTTGEVQVDGTTKVTWVTGVTDETNDGYQTKPVSTMVYDYSMF